MNKLSHSPFAKYCMLEEAAEFFLQESFRYIDSAAEYEVASVIFGNLIDQIEVPPEWKLPELPDSLSEWLQVKSEIQLIPDETTSQLADAWQNACSLARCSDQKLDKTHKLKSVDIVGHVINLAACVESVINRHLFLLRESGELEKSLYNRLDWTGVIPKLLFAFKDDIRSGKLQVSGLKKLYRLRNNSVHFTASNAHSITITIKELFGIWTEVGQIFDHVEGHPTKQDIEALTSTVAIKWFDVSVCFTPKQ